MRILAVDDDPDVLASLGDLLLELGHEVATVDRGEIALERLSEFRPDVILVDWHMPSMTGRELVDRIRDRLSNVPPIVVVSAAAEQGLPPDLPILLKPFTLDALVAALTAAEACLRS